MKLNNLHKEKTQKELPIVLDIFKNKDKINNHFGCIVLQFATLQSGYKIDNW